MKRVKPSDFQPIVSFLICSSKYLTRGSKYSMSGLALICLLPVNISMTSGQGRDEPNFNACANFSPAALLLSTSHL